ncbi:MAG: 3-hydroxyacyl-ACP dehydratase FabZ family protein [Phycisphaerales bacterium]
MQTPSRLLFDLSRIDLSARVDDKSGIERWNPHRGTMAFLDNVIWHEDDFTRAIGLRQVRDNEFWIDGHFPGKPMYPGVFQVETAAQLACYIFAKRKDKPTLAAFLRIEDCAFRSVVTPGDDLLILMQDVKFQRRRFVVAVQGVVGTRVTFDCQITGLAMD